MDWIRRNWPDLLIGLALLAVIAGIIATLLNGGSFFPFGGSSTPPSVSRSAPSTPSSTPSTSQTNPGGASTAEPGVTPVTPGDTATIPGGSSGAPGTTTTTTETTPSAGAGSGEASVTPVVPGASPSTEPGASTSTSASTAGASPSASSAAAASSLPSAPFRIGVGSYSQPDNAERRAEAFREAGYPVFTAQQGQYTVVLVGPYDSRSEAEAVQGRIRSSGLEENPILYEVEAEAAASSSPGTTSTVGGSSGSQTASTNASTSTPANTSASTAGGRYVQVGAYNSPELAEPQRERLEALGYSTTLQRTEGSSLLRLWIGPFSDERLAAVRAQLDELGIDNFVPAQ